MTVWYLNATLLRGAFSWCDGFLPIVFEDNTVPDADVGRRPGGEFDQRIRLRTAQTDPGSKPLLGDDFAVDQPEGVDRKRDEYHVDVPIVDGVEPKDERVIGRDRSAKHQATSPGENGFGGVDSRRQHSPIVVSTTRAVVGVVRWFVEEAHGQPKAGPE